MNQLIYNCECGWTSTGDRCKATCPECGSTGIKVTVNDDAQAINETRTDSNVETKQSKDVYEERNCYTGRKS